MINDNTPGAKARAQRSLLRQAALVEKAFRARVKTILNEQVGEAADLLEQGHTGQSMDPLLDQWLPDLRRVYYTAFLRSGEVFSKLVFDAVPKEQQLRSAAAPEVKGMADEFWSNFRSFISFYTGGKVAKVQKTTRKWIAATIAHGTQDGKSPGEIAKDLRAKGQFNKERAERIARTEVHMASNFATQEAVKSTRLRMEKEWVSMADERTRVAHRGTNGQRVPMEQDFTVGGERMSYPGDPRGSAGNVINCIAGNYKTPVFTDKGWKWVSKIVPGDLVLTHKNRFRKVLRTRNRPYGGQLIKISVGRKCVVVTPEHPLMVQGKWMKAEEIKKGNLISVMGNYCAWCGKPIPYWQKFCNISCSSKKTTERQWASEEHRANISRKASAQMRREYTNGIRDKEKIVKRARRVCFERYGKGGYLGNYRAELEPAIRNAINKKYGSTFEMLQKTAFPALGKTSKGTSKLEIAMERFLNRKNKRFKKQFSIGRRRIDFYIKTDKLFIEVDGAWWHKDKERDRKRDLEILMQYPDHKIAHVTYETGIPKWEYFDLMALNHTRTFCQLEMPVEEVTRFVPTEKRRVYNFAVEEDESYIVRGFVSHNCRCVLLYHTMKGR